MHSNKAETFLSKVRESSKFSWLYINHRIDGNLTYYVMLTGERRPLYIGLVTKSGVTTDLYKSFESYSDDLFKGINKLELISSVLIYKASNSYYGSSLYTDPVYRSKGIASKLYDFIESTLKIELTPEFSLTPDGQKFWNKRNSSK